MNSEKMTLPLKGLQFRGSQISVVLCRKIHANPLNRNFERESTLNRKLLKQLLNFPLRKCIIWTTIISQSLLAFIFLFCYWNLSGAPVVQPHLFASIQSLVSLNTARKTNNFLAQGSQSLPSARSSAQGPWPYAGFQSHSYFFPSFSANLESFLQISSLSLHLKEGIILEMPTLKLTCLVAKATQVGYAQSQSLP